MIRPLFLGLVAYVSVRSAAARAEETKLTVVLTAAKQDHKNVVVSVPLRRPAALSRAAVAVVKGQALTAWQQTKPGLLAGAGKEGQAGLELHFILPELKAGTTLRLPVRLDSAPPGRPPSVRDPSPFYRFGEDGSIWLHGWPAGSDKAVDRPVARYVHHPYDRSSKASRDRTYKVFHHLFDPAGKRLVTNGGYADEKIADPRKLLYPHHRGLMYAFNRISYDGVQQADTWHAQPGDTHQEHVRFLAQEAGPVLARQRVLIDWHGPKNDVFAREERELTFYNVPGGTLVDFVSRLSTTGSTVHLNGDPQHAGVQFRAANAVAEKSARETYFVRPDGKDKPGATRNWPGDRGHVNLPWDAMSFVLDGRRYTVAYFNHPGNRGEQRYSERDYGRFGCYFAADVTKDRPLVVRYRIWLQEGEMTVPQLRSLSEAFVDPPAVEIK